MQVAQLVQSGSAHRTSVQPANPSKRVPPPARHDLTTQEDVAPNGHVWCEGQALVDRLNASAACVVRGVQSHVLAANSDGTRRRLLNTGEELYQGALAGPVVSNQGEHFALDDVQIDLGQRRDSPIVL
jgi:hypothetical protein